MGYKIGYFTGYRFNIEGKEDFYKWALNCNEIIVEYDSICDNNRKKLNYIMNSLNHGDSLAIENFNEISMDVQFVNEYISKLLEKGVWVTSRKNNYTSYEKVNENKITIEKIERNFYTGEIKKTVGRKNRLLPKYASEIFKLYRENKINLNKAMYLLGIKKTKFFEEIKKYEESVKNKT